jgi:hypothetical protein
MEEQVDFHFDFGSPYPLLACRVPPRSAAAHGARIGCCSSIRRWPRHGRPADRGAFRPDRMNRTAVRISGPSAPSNDSPAAGGS